MNDHFDWLPLNLVHGELSAASGSWNLTFTELVPVTSTATRNGTSGGPESSAINHTLFVPV